jgi:predicted transcriptional regulator
MVKADVTIPAPLMGIRPDTDATPGPAGDANTAPHATSIEFTDWNALVRALTPKRLELLGHLRRHPRVSVSALAKALGRDYRNVYGDVALLSAAGLIKRDRGGRLQAEYDCIQARIPL